MEAESFNKPEGQRKKGFREVPQNAPREQKSMENILENQNAFARKDKATQKTDSSGQIKEDKQKGSTAGTPEDIAADTIDTIYSPAAEEEGFKKIGQRTNQQATPIDNRSITKAISMGKNKKDAENFSIKIATINKPVYTQFDTPNPDKDRSRQALVKHMSNLNTYTLKYAEMLRDEAIQKSKHTGQVIDERRKELAADAHPAKTGEKTETSRRERRWVGNRKREVDVYQKDGVEHIRYQEKDKLYKYRTYEEHQEVAVWIHNKELGEWTYNPVAYIHDKNDSKSYEKQQEKEGNIEEMRLNVRVRDVTVKDSKGDLTYKIESIEGEKCYSTGGKFIAWRPAKTNILSRKSREASIRASLIVATLESRLSIKGNPMDM